MSEFVEARKCMMGGCDKLGVVRFYHKDHHSFGDVCSEHVLAYLTAKESAQIRTPIADEASVWNVSHHAS
jgi:hypothetical protein